jgi:hypothetical protein
MWEYGVLCPIIFVLEMVDRSARLIVHTDSIVVTDVGIVLTMNLVIGLHR